MYIVPLNGITPLNAISQVKQKDETQESGDNASFTDVFKQAFQNVQDTQKVCEEDNIKVALGEIDDLHTVALNTKKAAVALETFVAMKNTAVDAYKEIMSMGI